MSIKNFDFYKNCVHCGLCLPTCPTYAELGDENDSPRGRIYLMQAIDQGRIQPGERLQHHLDLCLDCRACETVCPSGVNYGGLIESYRTEADGAAHRRRGLAQRLIDWILFHVFPFPGRTRVLLQLTRLGQSVGFFDFLRSAGLADRFGGSLMFPEVLSRIPRITDALPQEADPQTGPPDRRAGLFRGCLSETILGATNRATHRVLLRNQCAVYCPDRQVCCGAIHYHGGHKQEAIRLAKANIDAFDVDHVEAIVVNVAGCGLMLKDYAKLLEDDPLYAPKARRFVDKVRDVHEYLAGLPLAKPARALRAKVTYHEACHLCHGQMIRREPRAILQAIPGLELSEMSESDWCCGAAGAYSLTQPEMATRLARRKLQHIAETGSQIVAAGNAGCILHLRQQAALADRELTIVHPVDLLDQAYTQSQLAPFYKSANQH